MDAIIDNLYTDTQIKVLFSQLLASDFAASYPEQYFRRWCHNARSEIVRGMSVAIGAWTLSDEYSRERGDLAGACILKKSESLLGSELELEVIHVDSKYRNTHFYPSALSTPEIRLPRSIGKSLLYKVEDLSRQYGYSRIVTQVQRKFNGLFLFLLNQGFVTYAHDANQQVYHLAKYIEPIYNGDPYDGEKILDWLCKKWRIALKNWVVPSRHAVGLHSVGDRDQWQLGVDIFMCDDTADATKEISVAGKPLQLVVLKSEERNPRGNSRQNTYFVSPGALKNETKNSEIDLTLQDKTSALLVSIRKEHFERFDPSSSQAFMDGGDYGQVLMRRVENGVRRNAFIVFSDSTANNLEILGIGQIKSVKNEDPEVLWTKFKTKSTFVNRNEFSIYKNIKTKMTAIEFDQLEVRATQNTFSQKLRDRGWCYLNDKELHDILKSKAYPLTLQAIKPKQER